MTTYATGITKELLGAANASGFLVAVPGASVLIKQDGVACDVFADNEQTPMLNPIPTGVPPGMAGVDTLGNLLVYLIPGRNYTAVVTVGASVVTVALPDVNLDAEEPIPAGAVEEAMLAFGVATQAELDAQASAASAALATGLATRAPSTGIAQSAVTNLVSDLAAKAPATGIAQSAVTSLVTDQATQNTNIATNATAIATETSRASTQEALKLAKASNLSDVANAAIALANLGGQTTIPDGTYVQSFDPTRYGGDPLGLVDSTAAIATAVGLANAVRGAVLLNDGDTFLINSHVGSAPVAASSGQPRALLYFTGLAGVKFIGGGTLKTTAAYASTILEVRDSSDVTIDGPHFVQNKLRGDNADLSNIPGSCVRFTNVNRGAIRNCEVEQAAYSAIYLMGGTRHVQVTGNNLHDLGNTGGENYANGINEDALNGTSGGATAGCYGNIIAYNSITNCDGSGGVVLDNSAVSSQTLVVGNVIIAGTWSPYQGIRALNPVDCLIANNTVRGTKREGIYLGSTGASIAGNTISGNSVSTCGLTGGYAGIRVDNEGGGEIQSWKVTGNHVRNVGGHGIHVNQSGANQVRNGTITDNTVMNADQTALGTHDAIAINARFVMVMNNTVGSQPVSACHRYGIHVLTGASLVHAPFNNVVQSLNEKFFEDDIQNRFVHDEASGAIGINGRAFSAYGCDVTAQMRMRSTAKIWFGGSGDADADTYLNRAASGVITLGTNTATLAMLAARGVIFPDYGALPTASATYRGQVVTVQGGANVADGVYACVKLADGVYAWQRLDYHEGESLMYGLETGRYYFCCPTSAATTSQLVNGDLRVAPFPLEQTATIATIGMEVTTAGSAGAVYRVLVFRDNGTGRPSSLVWDSVVSGSASTILGNGLIDGTNVSSQEITANILLRPGKYHAGAVLQGSPVTAPFVRCTNAVTARLSSGTTLASTAGGSAPLGYNQTGVTAAGPSPMVPANAAPGAIPRIFFKVG